MTITRTAGGEATRAKLIEASYRLFSSQGFHATSMRDIAREAGITAGSIYNHFADKEQVVKDVLLAYHPIMKVLPVLEQVEGLSASDQIRDAARRVMEAVDASPGIISLMAVELIELRGQHLPELVEAMYPQVQAFLDRVYGCGADLRPKVPLTLFRVLIGQLLGYGLTRLAVAQSPAATEPEASLDEFIDLLLHGVLRSDTQAGPK